MCIRDRPIIGQHLIDPLDQPGKNIIRYICSHHCDVSGSVNLSEHIRTEGSFSLKGFYVSISCQAVSYTHLLTEAVQRVRSTATRTTRQTATRRSVPVAFGPCGKISQLRIRHSDIRRNSAQTLPRQTGNLLLSPLWMTVSSLISPTSASVTHVPARLLPVVS